MRYFCFDYNKTVETTGNFMYYDAETGECGFVSWNDICRDVGWHDICKELGVSSLGSVSIPNGKLIQIGYDGSSYLNCYNGGDYVKYSINKYDRIKGNKLSLQVQYLLLNETIYTSGGGDMMGYFSKYEGVPYFTIFESRLWFIQDALLCKIDLSNHTIVEHSDNLLKVTGRKRRELLLNGMK